MVSAGLDEANIIDTIKHAKAVNFDLSVQGQVDLSKAKVTGPVITAMKARAPLGSIAMPEAPCCSIQMRTACWHVLASKTNPNWQAL